MVLAMFPSLVLANALIPAINSYRNTPAFYFVFAVIVLIETLCVRLWLRQMHLVSVAWRVVLINIVSSFAGYVLMRTPLRPDFMYVWQQAIPFFFLTLSVELPLIILLFKHIPVSWRKKVVIGTIANVLSYAFLIIAERPVESVWLDRLRAADYQILRGWTNTQMLAHATGRIYGTESGPNRPHRLRFFELREDKWHSMANCPPIDPRYWDIEGAIVAFKHYSETGYSDKNISIRRLPDFSLITEITITNATSGQSNWDLKISPDRMKLAVLVPLHELRAPLTDSSYRYFGTTCDLVVYDISTGVIVGISPRKALRGLCWSPDSRRILFNSLRDESLHNLMIFEKGWQKKYPEADKLFSDAPTYAYDIAARSVELFGEMDSVHLASESGQLVSKTGTNTISIINYASGQTNEVRIGRLGYQDITVSPDGTLAIVHLTLKNPMAYCGYPTIVDMRDPSRRHYIEGGFDYRLEWPAQKERVN